MEQLKSFHLQVLLPDFMHALAKVRTDAGTFLLPSWNTAKPQSLKASSFPIDVNIWTCLQSDLLPFLLEQGSEFLPPASLVLLLISTNLPIEVSLLMWLFFLNRYSYVPRPLQGMVGCSGETACLTCWFPFHLLSPSGLFELLLSKIFVPVHPSLCILLYLNCLLFWKGIGCMFVDIQPRRTAVFLSLKYL